MRASSCTSPCELQFDGVCAARLFGGMVVWGGHANAGPQVHITPRVGLIRRLLQYRGGGACCDVCASRRSHLLLPGPWLVSPIVLPCTLTALSPSSPLPSPCVALKHRSTPGFPPSCAATTQSSSSSLPAWPTAWDPAPPARPRACPLWRTQPTHRCGDPLLLVALSLARGALSGRHSAAGARRLGQLPAGSVPAL